MSVGRHSAVARTTCVLCVGRHAAKPKGGPLAGIRLLPAAPLSRATQQRYLIESSSLPYALATRARQRMALLARRTRLDALGLRMTGSLSDPNTCCDTRGSPWPEQRPVACQVTRSSLEHPLSPRPRNGPPPSRDAAAIVGCPCVRSMRMAQTRSEGLRDEQTKRDKPSQHQTPTAGALRAYITGACRAEPRPSEDPAAVTVIPRQTQADTARYAHLYSVPLARRSLPEDSRVG